MARAFLNWGQPELAERCGVSAQTISNFERDAGHAEARTAAKIATVLEVAGIRLLPSGGIEPRNDLITVLEGDDAGWRLLDNIYDTLKEDGGEVLIAGLREADPSETARRQQLERHISRLQEAGITERILIEEGEKNLIAPQAWYRWLPSAHFSNTPFQVYGDRIALRDWGPPQRIVLVEHPGFAATFRNLFDVAWQHAKPVEISNA